MPKLIMLSGPSASGKSTLSKELMAADANLVRVNRDQIRTMSILKWTPKREHWIIDAEVAMVRAAAATGRNVLVDDTNLMLADTARWSNVAREMGYDFEKKVLNPGLLACVERDAKRIGAARIGRPSIERQFLRAGLIEWPADKQVVIFDIDGTLSDLTHRVAWITVGADCPNCKGLGTITYDLWSENQQRTVSLQEACTKCKDGQIVKKDYDEFYGRVLKDEPIEIVVKWIQACRKDFFILIVSGRSPEKCGEETVAWLEQNGVQYDHIFMRRSNMHGPDTEEKQLILNDILKMIPREKIAFVVDDRPSVVAMWRENFLRVFPVRGRDDHGFYEEMDKFEAEHPASLDSAPFSSASCGAQRPSWKRQIPKSKLIHMKPRHKRPLKSYLTQAVVRVRRFWERW